MTRIIPALAGNTGRLSPPGPWAPDHPRSRGEYRRRFRCAPRCAGSSPLSRGIRGERVGGCGGDGDHPRSRGEYLRVPHPDGGQQGSSPLSRGIRAICGHPIDYTRIIPALAGNTHTPAPQERRRPDHPRSRGEYLTAAENAMSAAGSSPLSRGIRELLKPRWRGTMDHPRSRGEYFCLALVIHSVRGSSPLSRGIQMPVDRLEMVGRIIPALAGNTPGPGCDPAARTDHPRSRGEYIPPAIAVTMGEGSSPLSRGIRLPSHRAVVVVRIIPALAGNTGRGDVRQVPKPDHPRSRGEY